MCRESGTSSLGTGAAVQTRRLELSVVIPALNAAASLARTIACLGPVSDIVVVDGGSRDGTPGVAASLGARVITAPRGRGSQLLAGIEAAREGWLLLLHADTALTAGWRAAAAEHMAADPERAGYFRFGLDSDDPRARRLERVVAWRCRRLALPYGDQGLLVHRHLLTRAGGVRPLPLMEDVDLVRRLGRPRLTALDADAVSSAIRWQRDGWYRRSAWNLMCLALWLMGVPPRIIARLYG
jgi:rSAM/selenodomain-associated transferase 2